MIVWRKIGTALASISIRTLAVLDSVWTWRMTASFRVLESDMLNRVDE